MKQFLQIPSTSTLNITNGYLKIAKIFCLAVSLFFIQYHVLAQTTSVNCKRTSEEFDFTYLSYTKSSNHTVTLTFSIQNNGRHALSHASFGLPTGAKAVSPSNLNKKFSYKHENTTFNPFYSVKFEATKAEDFKNGSSDVFSYTITAEEFSKLSTIQLEAKAGTSVGIVEFNSTSCYPAPLRIVGPALVEAQTLATYSVENAKETDTFEWAAPAGWEITKGQGTKTVTVKSNEAPGVMKVQKGSTSVGTLSVASYSLPPATLPVSLTSFTAASKNNTVVLGWATASEKDNQEFQVERSSNAVDFEFVQAVAGHGTTSVAQNYSFTDFAPANGTVYYRLKQVDFDGKFEYSKVVSVLAQGVAKPALAVDAAYPNPFQGEVTVSFTATTPEQVNITLVDLAGKTVSTQTFHANSGANTYLLRQLENLPGGLYILKVQVAQLTYTQRLVKGN